MSELPEVGRAVRQGAASVELDCPHCSDIVAISAEQWPQINVDGAFVISPIVSYGVTCEGCGADFYFKPHAAKEPWPQDDTTTVNCPNCDVADEVQLAEVRNLDLPLRPVDCGSCHAHFQLFSDGKTALVEPPVRRGG